MAFSAGDEVNTDAGVAKITKVIDNRNLGIKDSYLVELNGNAYVMRWFTGGKPRIKLDAFKTDDSFLVPFLLTKKNNSGFGCLYENGRFSKDMFTLGDYISASGNRRDSNGYFIEAEFEDCAAAISAAEKTLTAIGKIMSAGRHLSFFDPDSILFDPKGDTVLIDIVGLLKASSLRKSYGFIRPDVLGGSDANRQSDIFLAAALVYRILTKCNPFEGKRTVEDLSLSEESERRAFIESPMFVFDPDNDSNRPVRIVHQWALDMWPRLSKKLRDNLTCVLTGRGQTVSLKELTSNLVRYEMGACHCGTYVDVNNPGYSLYKCPECGLNNLSVVSGDDGFIVTDGRVLPECVFDTDSDNPMGGVLQFRQGKKDPSKYALFNISDRVLGTLSDGEQTELNIGNGAVLKVGLHIDLGNGKVFEVPSDK